MLEVITFHGQQVRRFVNHPEPITDGTIRCGVCGQLDDEEIHDDAICEAIDRSNRQFRALQSKESSHGG